MKCERCIEYKWRVKDCVAEIKEWKKQVEDLEEQVAILSARWYLKKCLYCPRDMVGHYEDCVVIK
jgi:hypothetical protein